MNEEIKEIINKIPVKVENLQNEILLMTFSDGSVGKWFHSQDCCESVSIEDVCGDFEDLLHTPLLVAEVRKSFDSDWSVDQQWTFYTFRTIKGSVDVRWYGTSNGFYSTSVDFRMLYNGEIE